MQKDKKALGVQLRQARIVLVLAHGALRNYYTNHIVYFSSTGANGFTMVFYMLHVHHKYFHKNMH